MPWLTPDQFFALGKKCSHCDKKATWLASENSPAYCDEHFPYYEEINKNPDITHSWMPDKGEIV